MHLRARNGAQLIEVDGTPNKTNIGANAILAVSMAAAKVRVLACRVLACRACAHARVVVYAQWRVFMHTCTQV